MISGDPGQAIPPLSVSMEVIETTPQELAIAEKPSIASKVATEVAATGNSSGQAKVPPFGFGQTTSKKQFGKTTFAVSSSMSVTSNGSTPMNVA